MHLRYALQDSLPRVTADLVEAIGGLGFVSSFDIAYFAGCLHAFALHPPTRSALAPRLYEFHRTGSFELPVPLHQ